MLGSGAANDVATAGTAGVGWTGRAGNPPKFGGIPGRFGRATGGGGKLGLPFPNCPGPGNIGSTVKAKIATVYYTVSLNSLGFESNHYQCIFYMVETWKSKTETGTFAKHPDETCQLQSLDVALQETLLHPKS